MKHLVGWIGSFLLSCTMISVIFLPEFTLRSSTFLNPLPCFDASLLSTQELLIPDFLSAQNPPRSSSTSLSVFHRGRQADILHTHTHCCVERLHKMSEWCEVSLVQIVTKEKLLKLMLQSLQHGVPEQLHCPKTQNEAV